VHFVAPHGKLYQKLLTLEQLLGSIPSINAPQRQARLLVNADQAEASH